MLLSNARRAANPIQPKDRNSLENSSLLAGRAVRHVFRAYPELKLPMVPMVCVDEYDFYPLSFTLAWSDYPVVRLPLVFPNVLEAYLYLFIYIYLSWVKVKKPSTACADTQLLMSATSACPRWWIRLLRWIWSFIFLYKPSVNRTGIGGRSEAAAAAEQLDW